MRRLSHQALILLATAVIPATLFGACAEEDSGVGACVTTHESLPEQRYDGSTKIECEDFCDSVDGFVCCYFEPDDGPWVAIDGDC